MARKCVKCGAKFSGDLAFCGNDGSVLILDMPAESADLRLGQQLGDYVIAAPVADGATGRVYEGRHAQTREKVAVKVLHAHVARDRIALERFKREAEAGKLMSYPYIVTVIDVGRTGDGSHFMTMEFLHGEELGETLRRNEKLTPAQIIRLISQIAMALDYAHSFGYVHRDLKPDNIFLCRDETGLIAKLLDFGSVKAQVEMGPKLTAIGTTLGSPFYMSPEQAMGKQDLDQRSDVFAFGSILYELLTGQVAFGANNVAEVLMKILQYQPPPPSTIATECPLEMDAVIAKALEKDKTKRHSTALEFASAVCQAYGIAAHIERWAHLPESDVVDALRASNTKKPAVPLRSSAPAPQQHVPSAKPIRLTTKPEFDDSLMAPEVFLPTRSWLGPMLTSIVVAGILVAAAMWWLGKL